MNYTAVREACNSWRIFDDVAGNWNSIASIIRYVDENQHVLAAAQGPGAWNDPDMVSTGIPAGNFGEELQLFVNLPQTT